MSKVEIDFGSNTDRQYWSGCTGRHLREANSAGKDCPPLPDVMVMANDTFFAVEE